MKFTLDTNTVELVLGLLGIVGWLFRLSSRVGVWEEKFKHTDEFVADMRKIFITNSLLDAQRRGVLQVSSPLRPNQAILDAFGDLGVRIVRHYNENGLSRESNDVGEIGGLQRHLVRHEEVTSRDRTPRRSVSVAATSGASRKSTSHG